ncbi:MAG: glycosyltransferase family 4 protein [Actinomycetota bacterium]
MGQARAMKVLFVSAGIVSDRRPHGEALIAHNIISRLARRGHEITVFCTEHDDRIEGVTFRKISADAPGAALSQLAFARRASRAALDVHADIHHLLLPLNTTHGYTLVSGSPLIVGPLMLPWPSSDGGAAPRNRIASAIVGGAVARIERRLHDRTLARASKLLVTGDPAKSSIHPSLRHKCSEVPYGVDTSRFVQTPIPSAPTILFFSVLLPRKGIATLIDALSIVRTEIPSVRLLVTGDDPRSLESSLKEHAVRVNAADAIQWLGSIAPHDAPELFARARVFCQPSHGEPFGMTILEAMASGRPVVATNAGGVPGIIREGANGRLVAPNDAQALARALIQTLTRDDVSRIGNANRQEAVSKFDWERVVDGIESAYSAARGVPHVRVAG